MWSKLKSFLFKNTSTKQTVAKNTIWLSISNFGGRLIKAVLVIYAARVLGTSEYGVFSYAVTLAGFLGIFIDPGINSVLMRDASKASDEDRRKIFSATMFLKIILIIAAASVIVFLGPYFTTLQGAEILLPAAAVIMGFDALREFLVSFLRSKEKMQWDAGIFLFTNFAIVIFGLAFMLKHPTAYALAWGYAAGILLGAIFAIIVVRKDIKEAFSQFSAKLTLPIIQAAWPFAITGALGLLFTNTDILIISWMKTAADVGIYSAAIRIIQVLYIVPGILQMSTLPLLSRLAKSDNAKFRITLEQTVSLIFLISMPLAIGGILLGTQLMTFIFGNAFASGGLPFKILSASLVVDYSGSVIVNAIFAYAHQKSLIISSAIGGFANVALDLLLIPKFGMTGSAIATLIAQIITNWYLWHMMKKINYFEIMPHLKKIAGATVVMGIVTAGLLFVGTNIILNIIISTAIYFLFLRIFREPVLREIKRVIMFGTA